MNGEQQDIQQGAYQEPDSNYEAPRVPPYEAGIPKGPVTDTRGLRKSPALATVLSLMPGLGQIYVGYYPQGFTNALVCFGTIALLATGAITGMEPFFGPFLGFYWVYNMVDANRRAHHYNRVLEGLGGETVPDDFKMPSGRGSMLGGVVLVVLGLLFFLDLNFGISVSWIKDWWPILLIIFGANLIYKARKN